MLQTKVFVILDNVSEKMQLDFLLGNLDWKRKGSKIIITRYDKSLLKGFANDTYIVPFWMTERPINSLVILALMIKSVAPLTPKGTTHKLPCCCGKDETGNSNTVTIRRSKISGDSLMINLTNIFHIGGWVFC